MIVGTEPASCGFFIILSFLFFSEWGFWCLCYDEEGGHGFEMLCVPGCNNGVLSIRSIGIMRLSLKMSWEVWLCEDDE